MVKCGQRGGNIVSLVIAHRKDDDSKCKTGETTGGKFADCHLES